MHTLYINSIGYLQEALLNNLTHAKKRQLDERVRNFMTFRNPSTGCTTRKVMSLSKIGYISAEMRVIHLFMWSHAVGSKANIFDPPLRSDVLKCICSLQIICFSVRNNFRSPSPNISIFSITTEDDFSDHWKEYVATKDRNRYRHICLAYLI